MYDKNIIVIIDVFRAFSTAAFVLARSPNLYFLTNSSSIISELANLYKNPILIGKAEIGQNVFYTIPNSPTRTKALAIEQRIILHRTEAGAKGILNALQKNPANIVLAASFVNAKATAKYITTLPHKKVTLIPMGHEAVTPSLEDNLCAEYIYGLLKGKSVFLSANWPSIRKGAGKYFFTDDQWQYPKQDFNLCLKPNQFNFAIQANLRQGYAHLTPVWPNNFHVPVVEKHCEVKIPEVPL